MHSHQYFARPRTRRFGFLNLQHLRSTRLGDDDCAHVIRIQAGRADEGVRATGSKTSGPPGLVMTTARMSSEYKQSARTRAPRLRSGQAKGRATPEQAMLRFSSTHDKHGLAQKDP